ncbi:hypothetical protein [Nocardioides sp. YIM 152588]|uniref:hypothetical protein n=1 Tax=Nocardioides sp. YIM 152588 TaxID=3158259 RepID=UPI0032E4A651
MSALQERAVGATAFAPAAGVPTLRHPGPVADERVVAVAARLTPHEVELPAGVPLLDALAGLLDSTGARSAVGELVGGELAEFGYYVPDLGPEGGAVATFSPPRTAATPARLVRGGLTLGHRDGAVFSHTHALFEDAHGVRRAGHLIPDTVVLGAGVSARVWTSTDVAIEVRPDPETTMSLFVPRAIDGADVATAAVDALVCRVRPNVDLVGVIEHLVERAGWSGAEVRGQIGSLVGGLLRTGDGALEEVDGPATEVMFLDGAVRRVAGRVRADLAAGLLDRHAAWHHGTLVPGHNPVAMTYELVLVRADDEPHDSQGDR